jgi:hypothetical protein
MRPCTRDSYRSLASLADDIGRSSKDFKEGKVGPIRSISKDSSFSSSVVISDQFREGEWWG